MRFDGAIGYKQLKSDGSPVWKESLPARRFSLFFMGKNGLPQQSLAEFLRVTGKTNLSVASLWAPATMLRLVSSLFFKRERVSAVASTNLKKRNKCRDSSYCAHNEMTWTKLLRRSICFEQRATFSTAFGLIGR